MSNIGAYDLLKRIAERVREDWQAQVKVVVAENPAHGIELLTNARSATLVIFYVSDAPVGNSPFDMLDVAVEASIRFGLVRSPGMAVKGVKPAAVLQDVDSLRGFLSSAAAVFNDVLGDGYLEYKGMSYIATEQGKLLNGYALTFSPLYAYEVG